MSKDKFLGLDQNISANDFEIEYKITEGLGYAGFEHLGNSYYIQVEGVPGVTDMNDANIRVLLEDLFG